MAAELMDELAVMRRRITQLEADAAVHQQVEEALRISEAQFRTLVEAMDDVIFTLDHEQRHTGVFGRWLEKRNLKAEFFIGKTASQILGPEVAGIHEEANRRALAGENVIYEWSVPGPLGTEYFQTSVSPIQDSRGEVIGIVGVGRDITVRKQMEAELQEAVAKIKTLKGLIPICASCKKIRNDQGFWMQVEVYIREHSEVEFTHGLCPDCLKKLYPDLYNSDKEPLHESHL